MGVFEVLVQTTWQVALLVLLAWGVERLLGRRLAPRWRYSLWFLVALRLAVPFTVELPGGAPSIALTARAPAETELVETRVTPIATPRPDPEGEGGSVEPTSPSAGPTSAAPASLEPAGSGRDERESTGGFPWSSALLGVWILGAGLLLARTLLRERAFRRRLAGAPALEDERVLALLEECRRRSGLRRPVRAVATDLVGAPAVTGIVRPTLLLPADAVDAFDEQDLRLVFLHELAHVRRGDVLVNAALSLLRCLYWFHPLVPLAFARFESARESLRDYEAMRIGRATAPASYANTLLKLLERRVDTRAPAAGLGLLHTGRDIQRRIEMIADFGRFTRGGHALGAVLLLGLGWFTFTSAAGGDGAVQPEGQELDRIVCERTSPPPPWRQRMLKALSLRLEASFENVSFEVIVDFLREATGLNFVVQTQLVEDLQDEGRDLFELDAGGNSAGDFLALFCRSAGPDVGYCLTREVVYIGRSYELPEDLDMRLYKASPLVEESWLEDAGELAQLVTMYAGGETWDLEGRSIEYWNDLLVVVQSEPVHAEVQAFLDRLLNRGRALEAEPEWWRERVEKGLATRVDVVFGGQLLAEVVDYLGQASGLTILLDPDYAEEYIEVWLKLNGATVADVLEWLTRDHGLRVVVRDGGVLLTQGADLALEFYEIDRLLENASDERELRDWIEMTIRDNIDPGLWDEYPTATVSYWNDLLIVNATAEAHAKIAQLVDALHRALL